MTKISKRELYKLLSRTDDDVEEIDLEEINKLADPDLNYHREEVDVSDPTLEDAKQVSSIGQLYKAQKSDRQIIYGEVREVSKYESPYEMPHQKLGEANEKSTMEFIGSMSRMNHEEAEEILPVHSFSRIEKRPKIDYFDGELYKPYVEALRKNGTLRHEDYANVLLGKKTYAKFLDENPKIRDKQRTRVLYKNMLGYRGTNGGVNLKIKYANMSNYYDVSTGINLGNYKNMEEHKFHDARLSGDIEENSNDELQVNYLKKGLIILDELFSEEVNSDKSNSMLIVKLFEIFYRGYNLVHEESNYLINEATYALLRGFKHDKKFNHDSIEKVCKRFYGSIMYDTVKDFETRFLDFEGISQDDELQHGKYLLQDVLKNILNIQYSDKSLITLVNPNYHKRKLARFVSKCISPTKEGIPAEDIDKCEKLERQIIKLASLANVFINHLEGKTLTDNCNSILEILNNQGIRPSVTYSGCTKY